MAAYALGKYKEAIEHFTRAIELDPQNGNYRYNRGNARRDAGVRISAHLLLSVALKNRRSLHSAHTVHT